MQEADAGQQPTSLVGLQIVIAPEHQGKRLSTEMVQKLKDIAAQINLKRVIIPVRPTLKHKYPLTPIEQYINGNPGQTWHFQNQVNTLCLVHSHL